MASSFFLPRYHPDIELPDAEEDEKERPMLRSGSVRAFSHLPPPNPAPRFQPVDEMADEPPSGAEPPETDAPSFHAPQKDEPATDETSLNDSSVSGLMQKFPMLPGHVQQQAQDRMTNSNPYRDPQALTEADTPPQTHPFDDAAYQRGIPQDNRPPATAPNAPIASPSRWLQKREAPGTAKHAGPPEFDDRLNRNEGISQEDLNQTNDRSRRLSEIPNVMAEPASDKRQISRQPPSLSNTPKDSNKTSNPPPPPKPSSSRLLSEGEKQLVKSIFGDSIKDLDKVEIRNRQFFPFQPSGTTVTPNGNIYPGKNLRSVKDFSKEDLWLKSHLIHEMTHVWQRQNGMNVLARGLVSSIAPYDYVIKPGKAFHQYPMEQQATIIGDYLLSLQGEKSRPRYRDQTKAFYLHTPAEY
jgi:hypothetical protein